MKPNKNKKGSLVSTGKSFAITLLVIAIIATIAGIIATALLNTGTAAAANVHTPVSIISQTENLTLNFTDQWGTVGTLMGVALIVAVVVVGLIALFKKGVF